ncbi:acyl carrier protein [Streptomyces sp. NPDC001714]|uniref:acyl carrier protein n=1 Tax=Streptomyces sp. NPDC001714 TaxID=3364603 RepID=UPI0036A99B0E
MLSEVRGFLVSSADVEFGSVGLDSLQTIEWLSMLEDRLGFYFDLEDLDFHSLRRQSIADVLQFLNKTAAGGSPA